MDILGRRGPFLTMKKFTCIECGGTHGHHFTGCPETPEESGPTPGAFEYDEETEFSQEAADALRLGTHDKPNV
jgi:hypothetical protein